MTDIFNNLFDSVQMEEPIATPQEDTFNHHTSSSQNVSNIAVEEPVTDNEPAVVEEPVVEPVVVEHVAELIVEPELHRFSKSVKVSKCLPPNFKCTGLYNILIYKQIIYDITTFITIKLLTLSKISLIIVIILIYRLVEYVLFLF